MTAIVFGHNHNNTLGLVRSLGEGGHRVILLLYGDKVDYVDKSRYVCQCVKLGRQDDALAAIKEVARQYGDKPVLFTTGDGEASLVDDNIAELSEYVIPEGGRTDGTINRYRNKSTANELAAQLGFNLPESWIARGPENLPGQISYPVMVKADNSTHGGKAVQRICNSASELASQLKSIPEEDFPVQIQQYIDKEFEVMLQGCSLDDGKTVVSKVANRKIRFYPHPYSAGSYSYSVEIDSDNDLKDLREKVSRYLAAIGYSGLFSAEFLYSKGKYYFLEVNLRNDGTAYLSTRCGCNLPDIYCRHQQGEDVEAVAYTPAFYMNAIEDFHHVRNGKLLLTTWIRQFFGTRCFSHFNWHDIRPYLYYFMARKINTDRTDMEQHKHKILLRFDDVCPTMNWEQWGKAMKLLKEVGGVKALIGVIPDCQDPRLKIDPPREDFWEYIRKLQTDGHAIAMHGLHHVFELKANGIVTRNKISEFAGLPYQVQLDKIRKGKEIMASHGIDTDIFFAPAHSYDDNTLRALAACGFKWVSDGRSAKPYKRQGIVCLPERSGGVPEIKDEPYYTVVLHAHEWVREDKCQDWTRLVQLVERHHEELVSFQNYCQQPIGIPIMQRTSEMWFRIRYKLTHSICK